MLPNRSLLATSPPVTKGLFDIFPFVIVVWVVPFPGCRQSKFPWQTAVSDDNWLSNRRQFRLTTWSSWKPVLDRGSETWFGLADDIEILKLLTEWPFRNSVFHLPTNFVNTLSDKSSISTQYIDLHIRMYVCEYTQGIINVESMTDDSKSCA